MPDCKLALIWLGGLLCLYYSTINPNDTKVVVENEYYNVSVHDVFEFVTNPDSFDKWFRWISRVYPADHKLIGNGKKYIVFFVRSPLIFETKNLTVQQDNYQISLEGDTILRPAFELQVLRTCRYLLYPRIKIRLTLSFQRYSLLFEIFVGAILKGVAKERLLEALNNLEPILHTFVTFSENKML